LTYTEPIIAAAPGSPGYWITRLGTELDDQIMRVQPLFDYYEGLHPLPHATLDQRHRFREFLRESRTNWCELVVDAVADRLEVAGFRFGKSDTPADDVWDIWQANHLDAESGLVMRDALVAGTNYVSVWGDDSPSKVTIVPEDPRECIVAYEPGSRRRRVAALKRWFDPVRKMSFANVYLPATVHRYEADGDRLSASAGSAVSWRPRRDGEPIIDNPSGVVPIVEFRPRPRSIGPGRSELEGILSIQNRINRTVFSRMVTTEYSAFRQRWATGLEVPKDPNTGRPVEPFEAAVSRVWTTPNDRGRFGEFSETDLSGYLKVIEGDVNALAAISRTPPHYLLGALVNISGDALKAAEAGLVKKASTRRGFLTESWEEVMRVALAFRGDKRANDLSSEVLWASPEIRTEGELVDSLLKMDSLGVPRPELWRRWGATETEIARWEAAGGAERDTPGEARDAPATTE
jgi:hypothetical protein